MQPSLPEDLLSTPPGLATWPHTPWAARHDPNPARWSRALLTFTLVERRCGNPEGLFNHSRKDHLPGAQGTCSHISAGLIQERMGTHWGTGASQHSQRSTAIFLSQGYTPVPLLVSTQGSWASIDCVHPHRLLNSSGKKSFA